MTRKKDFGTGPDLSAIEPISFTLHGEEFHCAKQVPGKVLLSLVKGGVSEDPGESAAVIDKFFETVLLPESLERFNVLVVDPNRIVTVDTLADIVNWLMEEYSDRPESQPEVS